MCLGYLINYDVIDNIYHEPHFKKTSTLTITLIYILSNK